jgi:hypothetical protein
LVNLRALGQNVQSLKSYFSVFTKGRTGRIWKLQSWKRLTSLQLQIAKPATAEGARLWLPPQATRTAALPSAGYWAQACRLAWCVLQGHTKTEKTGSVATQCWPQCQVAIVEGRICITWDGSKGFHGIESYWG